MLTRNQVARAYRRFLDREPENDDVVAAHIMLYETPEALATAILASTEYLDRFASRVPPKTFTIEQIDEVAAAFQRQDRAAFDGAVLELPDWFDLAADPDGDAHREQIMRLWREITLRRQYDATFDEDTPEVADLDFIRRPAFYATGDATIAGGHIMAIGHALLRSGVREGSRVLEYGAGFGQTALAFARLGATVDTVDVNPAFCRGVNALGEHYQVALKAHGGTFGIDPGGKPHGYDLIFFYESFHHCADAASLAQQMRSMLRPGGCVLLAGEPIFATATREMPYAWGFRLDWENIAIMRLRGWLELGYQESYLMTLFEAAGFKGERFDDPNSHWAQVFRFRAS